MFGCVPSVFCVSLCLAVFPMFFVFYSVQLCLLYSLCFTVFSCVPVISVFDCV